jgi:formylglycine-generating enzyme required for sulfatase activity
MNLQITLISLLEIYLVFSVGAAFATPTVTNLLAQQRAGTKLVDIVYDLSDPESSSLNVSVAVSADNGASFLPASHFSGNGHGSGVTTGTGKQIVWDAGADWNGNYSAQVWFQVTADDSLTYVALIPAGSFTMGDTLNDGWAGETPAHTLHVGTFYMDRLEVTKALWNTVYQWATNNGYTFDSTGGGKATDHPVQTVNWYDCVKWCNARSEMEGWRPCYYTSAARGTVYRTGNLNLGNDYVNWSANGYRLPTEAEWEKAARGGAAGRRFAWSDADTITQDRANYFSYWAGWYPYYPYDLNPTEGYHPTYAVGGKPYTSPAGSFDPNDYGLYDMTGNAWEWCWDWYDAAWYDNAGATQPDTPGPSTGGARVGRGGSWSDYASGCRAAARNSAAPSYKNSNLGFRCVRNQLTGYNTIGSAVYGPITVDTQDEGTPVPADFDGDRKADPNVVYSTGNWYVWLSSFGYRRDGPYQLGLTGGTLLAGDFDGDRKADPAMVDSSGNWYVLCSYRNYQLAGPFPLGQVACMPVVGDFDGDGKADPARARGDGIWHIWESGNNYAQVDLVLYTSLSGTPVAGDFDGDAKADPALVDGNGTWHIWKSGDNYALVDLALHSLGGRPVAGDFDGDGLADPAMVISSRDWYIWLSSENYQLNGPFLFY